MKYLITGGAGFIGTNLVNELMKDKDNTVTVYDNLNIANVGKDHKIPNCHNFIESSITNSEEVSRAFQGQDVIIHLAANTGVLYSINNPIPDMVNNIYGTLLCLDKAVNSRVPKFIFASSGAVIGPGNPPFSEFSPTNPISPYGVSKLSGEHYCNYYSTNYRDFDTKCLRFSNVYGPHSLHKTSAVGLFIKNCIENKPITINGDGVQTRDFIYVDDLVRAIILASKTNKVGKIFNIATGSETTILALVTKINDLSKKYLGKKVEIIHGPRKDGEMIRNYSKTVQARHSLGFIFKYTLDEGLDRTFKWYMENL